MKVTWQKLDEHNGRVGIRWWNPTCRQGEGGGVTTNDKSIFYKINRFHDLGMGRMYGQPDPVGNIAKEIGLNYHYNELSAALLLAQFEKINIIIKRINDNWLAVFKSSKANQEL